MKRFYIIRDGISVDTKEKALEIIRMLQRWDNTLSKRSKFGIIEGEEEIIPYPNEEKGREDEKNG